MWIRLMTTAIKILIYEGRYWSYGLMIDRAIIDLNGDYKDLLQKRRT